MTAITIPHHKVLKKSRNRIYGKKRSHNEILKEIVKLALQGTPIQEIAKITGKGRTSVWSYLDEAAKQGLIQKTSTGRIRLARQIKDSRIYEIVDKDRFVKKYKAVADWVADMRTRNGGKPVVAWRSNLNKLKTVCDTLALNPYALLSQKNGKQHGGAEEALRDFARAMQTGKVRYVTKAGSKSVSDDISSRFFNYVMAIRNFCAVNSVAIPAETPIQKCSIALGKFNHAVLVKGLAKEIGSGIEQRDAAIKVGGVGATTLVFTDAKFLMPDKNIDSLRNDPKVRAFITSKLRPEDNDVIIIGSADDKKTAEMVAKSAALQTVADHEKHF